MRALRIPSHSSFLTLAASLLALGSPGCKMWQGHGLAARFQVGRANRVCSTFTAMLDGPITARSRTEGQLKSTWEVFELFPVIDIPVGLRHAWLAGRGMTWPEYRHRLRYGTNLNAYPGSLEAIAACERRGVASPADANALRRHLCFGEFIHADLLVDAARRGAITKKEARRLFFDMLASAGDWPRFNYYVHDGDRGMMGKLAAAGLVSRGEAAYFVARWLVVLPRADYSLLQDALDLGVLTRREAAALALREFAYWSEAARRRGASPVRLAPPYARQARPDRVARRVREIRERLRHDYPRPHTLPAWLR